MRRPATISSHDDRILLGVGLMLGFCAVAPMIDVFAKMATAHVSVGMITLGRFLFQAVLMLPVLWAMGLSLRLPAGALGLVALRALASVVSTLCFVAAVALMPIADALAIAFVEPFVLMLLGAVALRETVGWRRITASLVGFGGSLFVIQPSFVAFGPVALLPLGTAVSFAFYMLITRQLSRRLAPVPMQLHTAWVAVLICLPVLAVGDLAGVAAIAPSWPSLAVWGLLFGTGLAASIAHLFMTYSLRFAPSATVAPLAYAEIVTAVAAGWLFFRDFPAGLVWVGIAIVTASGLYIIHREHVVARDRRLATPPETTQR
jgi:drug/metabolite transporter (DMT)-like permease